MATPQIQLTRNRIAKLLQQERSTREVVRDAEQRGLTLVLSPTGSASWVVSAKSRVGKTIRATLGRYPDIDVADARKRARATLNSIHDGVNPAEQRRHERVEAASAARDSITLREAVSEYFQLNPTLRESTRREYTQLLNNVCPKWMDRELFSITARDVRERHATYKSRAQANGMGRLLSAVFNTIITLDELDKANPVAMALSVRGQKRWHKIRARTTWLGSAEQTRAWADAVDALPSHQVRTTGSHETARDLFWTLAFTGMRLSEAMTLRWEQVDFTAGTITLTETKTVTVGEDDPVVLPMNTPTRELLEKRDVRESEWVFPGLSGRHFRDVRPYVDLVRADSELGWFKPHDLRRTFVSLGEALGVTDRSLKRLVGHATGDEDITNRYAQADLEALREASEKIAARLLYRAGRSSANVVPISAATPAA